MAAECTPTATATLYTLIPFTSTSSTFTSTVTTLDPVVTTITQFTCEDSGDPDETGCVSSEVEVESTLFGTSSLFSPQSVHICGFRGGKCFFDSSPRMEQWGCC